MSVSPDVMDGVPEERGYYWCILGGVQPKLAWVYWHPGNREILEARIGFGEQKMITEEDFGRHDWSEKIEPPELSDDSN